MIPCTTTTVSKTRPEVCTWAGASVRQSIHRRTRQHGAGGQDGFGVDPGHVLESERDALGPLAAGMGSGAGGGGAGGQHHHEEGDEDPAEPQSAPGHHQRSPPRPVPGLQNQDHGHGQEGHPHHEVDHHHIGVELGIHHECADHGLADDPEDQPSRQPPQVGPGRSAEERGHHGDGAGDDQKGDDQPVTELDEGVETQRRGQVML